jgi:hypothetical protein
MDAKMDAIQTEMRSIICVFRSELKATIQHAIRAVIQSVRSELGETTACHEATEADTETEPDLGMIQSIEEHQETPKGEAVVMPVGEPRKRRRVRNLAAEHRPGKSWIQEEVGCRLQEGVPLCKSGMAIKKPHQEYSDPGKS